MKDTYKLYKNRINEWVNNLTSENIKDIEEIVKDQGYHIEGGLLILPKGYLDNLNKKV